MEIYRETFTSQNKMTEEAEAVEAAARELESADAEDPAVATAADGYALKGGEAHE